MKNTASRGSGVLLHISSLPGDFGCGSFGKEAFDFVDMLANVIESDDKDAIEYAFVAYKYVAKAYICCGGSRPG